MASSFSAKLGRLPPMTPAFPTESAPLAPSAVVAAAAEAARAITARPYRPTFDATPERANLTPPPRPSLDELRDRIAGILGKSAAPAAPKPPLVRRDGSDAASWIEHAFVEEVTDAGTVYRARLASPAGQRVGAVPIAPARWADPALLALLALDPRLAECKLDRALYLDTETTGLAGGAGTVPFLIGLGAFDEGGFTVEQLLLRTFAEEAAMLEHLRARVEEATVIVTFNGKSFDWPLIRARAVMNRLKPLPERPHLDLLHIARRLHKHRVSSCALARVEDEVLGQGRVDDVCGADIVAIYHHYVRARDLAALEPVVQHNRLDVVSMAALVSLYGEPLDTWATSLHATDIAAASRVAKRAGDLDRALAFAEVSVERGGGADGHRARGDVARARGDKAAALSDYERALADLETVPASATEPGKPTEPAAELRLELAKLYEHHARAFDKALATLSQGTTEDAELHDRRLKRLARKLEAKAEKVRRAPVKKRAKARASTDAAIAASAATSPGQVCRVAGAPKVK